MIKGIFQAGQNLQIGEKQIGVISNNLANMGTSGYKKAMPFYQILMEEGETVTKQVTDFAAGEKLFTGNPLDVALKGDAYFTVDTKNGERLTRDGNFSISQEGYLTHGNDNYVVGEGGLINLKDVMSGKDNKITITADGMIMVGSKVVDKLMIMRANEDATLIKDSEVYFKSSDDDFSQVNEGEFEVSQGFLEGSNVSPIEEMESMISLSKSYESAKNILTYLDESLEKANQIGKVF